jgi:hypothetical protein
MKLQATDERGNPARAVGGREAVSTTNQTIKQE